MSSSTTGHFSSRPPPDATKRPTRRPEPRRPAAPATGTGTYTGPIRPLKKPPPAPTGVTCGYGICCHFGLTCVNPHSPEEVRFFVQRHDLRLQLREMALQVEGQKILHSKAKLASRNPLQDCTNKTKQPSSKGAAPAPPKQPTAKRASPVKSPLKPQPTRAAAATASPVPARPRSPTRPPPPTPHATAMATVVDVNAHPHYRCMSMGNKCSPECSVRTRADKAVWQGKWQPAHPSYSVWGRTEPPSWHQAPDPNPDYRYVLEPGKGHTIHVDYGVHWGNEKHNQWVRDSDTDLWFPVWGQDGVVLMRPCNNNPIN